MAQAFVAALLRGDPTQDLVAMVRGFQSRDDVGEWNMSRVSTASLLWALVSPEDEHEQPPRQRVIDIVLNQPENRQLELFRALIEGIPNFRMSTNPSCPTYETFLHRALFRIGENSVGLRIIEILADSGVTRMKAYANLRETPLHRACSNNDPNLIDLLMDVDGGALRQPDAYGLLPLHRALEDGDELITVLPRMVELYPESLFYKDLDDTTPVMDALRCSIKTPISEQFSSALMELVRQAPDSVRYFSRQFGCSTMLYACCRCPHVEFIAMLLEFYPIALTLVGMEGIGLDEVEDDEWYKSLLPADAVREALARQLVSPEVKDLIDQETKAILLAVIEIVLHDTVHQDVSSTAIKDHLKTTIGNMLPFINLNGSSFSVAQSIRETGIPIDLCTTALHHQPTQDLLRRDERFRNIVSGLYQMNKTRRDYGRGSTALGQLQVLECVTDNLDCIFLHLRESTELFTPQPPCDDNMILYCAATGLNTCIGKENYNYFFRTMIFIFIMQVMHIAIQIWLLVDTMRGGSTLANDWFNANAAGAIKGVWIAFIVFDGLSVFLIGQLLYFHILLRSA